jgi:transcriptional regulator with XRE-family HTH domain
MSLGTKVKQLREDKGWTQVQLASNAGLGGSGRQYISLLEINKINNPSAEKLLKIARALGIHEDVLYQAAGLKADIRPNAELEEFIYFLHDKNPNPTIIRQLRKIAEALMPDQGATN